MRHNKSGTTLDRKSAVRKMLLRNLATDLVMHEKIKTTSAKAKAVKPIVEKIITRGKKEGLANYRQILRYLTTESAANKVMKNLSPRYKERPGGYTRIIKLGNRKGDGAEVVQIEFV